MNYQEMLEQIKPYQDKDLHKQCLVNHRGVIISLLKAIQVFLFPTYYHYEGLNQEKAFYKIEELLEQESRIALNYAKITDKNPKEITTSFLEELPTIYRLINTDLQAIYDGDPAAKSKAEVILCYPGFYAIMIYRIAHVLYNLEIPYIPRIMSEYAHEKTGIDINPGATIGEYFCIDHGTGIVIGETAIIGDHVKLYQGVTIGAKSFEKDEHGNPIKGGKRHPNIGDDVIIYANATILGAETTIGDHSIIGGNAWITSSLEAGSKVVQKE